MKLKETNFSTYDLSKIKFKTSLTIDNRIYKAIQSKFKKAKILTQLDDAINFNKVQLATKNFLINIYPVGGQYLKAVYIDVDGVTDSKCLEVKGE